MALVEQVLAGESRAQEEFALRMRCIARILAGRNQRMGRPLGHHDIADLTQVTVVKVWQKLPTYEGRASLETWVYKFCTFELLSYLRGKHRLPRTMTDMGEGAPPEPSAPVQTESHEPSSIKSLLRHLAPREAEVIQLRHLEGVDSLREVSELLDISLSSVKTHYYRGLEKLREILENKQETGEAL